MMVRTKMVPVDEFYTEMTQNQLLDLRLAMRGGNASNDTVQLLNHVAKVLKGNDELSRALRERAQFLQAGIDKIDAILETPVTRPATTSLQGTENKEAGA